MALFPLINRTPFIHKGRFDLQVLLLGPDQMARTAQSLSIANVQTKFRKERPRLYVMRLHLLRVAVSAVMTGVIVPFKYGASPISDDCKISQLGSLLLYAASPLRMKGTATRWSFLTTHGHARALPDIRLSTRLLCFLKTLLKASSIVFPSPSPGASLGTKSILRWPINVFVAMKAAMTFAAQPLLALSRFERALTSLARPIVNSFGSLNCPSAFPRTVSLLRLFTLKRKAATSATMARWTYLATTAWSQKRRQALSANTPIVHAGRILNARHVVSAGLANVFLGS